MAGTTEVVRASAVSRVTTFVREVAAELRKVTWPDRNQVRQLSIAVLVFALAVGALIALMDLVLQGILVRLIPSILRGS